MPRRYAAILISGAALAACGESTEDLKRELDDFVSQSSSCQADSECVVATIPCPFGCYAAVNRDKKEAVEAKGQELRKELSGSHECDCPSEPASVQCAGGHCALPASR